MKINSNLITSEYNLITDGSAVKTGRKIDGKDEYIKRITCSNLGANGVTKQYASGIDVPNSIITKFDVFAVSNTNNWFPLPNYDSGSSKINILSSGNIAITFYNDFWVGETAYVDISYISK